MSQTGINQRMKENYENRTRYMLPRRTYTILRIDGRAFHSYTRGLKYYDRDLADAFNWSAKRWCEETSGAKLAFVQSDEVSVLLTDFDTIQTQPWFDGNLQKLVSVGASLFTMLFNLHHATFGQGLATFDCRAFTISDPYEVENYFIARQMDATRNSVSVLAQEHFSPLELHGKHIANMMDMLMLQKNINWNDEPVGFKRGRVIAREKVQLGRGWVIHHDPPVFTEEREFLRRFIPVMDSWKSPAPQIEGAFV